MVDPDNYEVTNRTMEWFPGLSGRAGWFDNYISERDGQPFEVRYGLKGISDHAIVFEAEELDGKRMVAFNQPREVDSAEYDQLWNSKPPKKRRAVKDEMSSAFDAN